MNEIDAILTSLELHLNNDLGTALVSFLGGVSALALRWFFSRRTSASQLRLVEAQHSFTAAQELLTVVNGLKVQVEQLYEENERLRRELARLSDKLDRFQAWIRTLPAEVRQSRPTELDLD